MYLDLVELIFFFSLAKFFGAFRAAEAHLGVVLETIQIDVEGIVSFVTRNWSSRSPVTPIQGVL